MGTTVRRIHRFVQKMAENASLDSEETSLAKDCVVGISKTGSCRVSDIARRLPGQNLRKMVRPFYDGLAAPWSHLDALRIAWLKTAARTADNMPFIAVDPSDIIKLHGKKFEFLDIVRDASDPSKRIGPGFPTIQIEATDFEHRNLPLWHEVFSTVVPPTALSEKAEKYTN